MFQISGSGNEWMHLPLPVFLPLPWAPSWRLRVKHMKCLQTFSDKLPKCWELSEWVNCCHTYEQEGWYYQASLSCTPRFWKAINRLKKQSSYLEIQDFLSTNCCLIGSVVWMLFSSGDLIQLNILVPLRCSRWQNLRGDLICDPSAQKCTWRTVQVCAFKNTLTQMHHLNYSVCCPSSSTRNTSGTGIMVRCAANY